MFQPRIGFARYAKALLMLFKMGVIRSLGKNSLSHGKRIEIHTNKQHVRDIEILSFMEQLMLGTKEKEQISLEQ